MGLLSPAFMMDLETNMRLISSQAYDRLNKKTWWNKVAKKITTQNRKERLMWMLDTAQIERTIRSGGQVNFDDMVMLSTELESDNAVAGLEIKKEELDDLDGAGVKKAAAWSRQTGAYSVYWPQKEVARLIKANPTTYDGLALFHGSHPYNPFDPDAGVFANRLTGAASGAFPGAVPIHDSGAGSVTVDVAMVNLHKAVQYINGAIKMPNGEDPRNLRVSGILAPPALMPRLVQLTNAKIIAQAAASGGASADIAAVINYMGLASPIEAPELGAAFGGSDTTYYLICEDILSDELGAVTYLEREPFSVVYHGPMTDAQLARIRKFQWTTEGRNNVEAGHPFLIFRCDAT